MKQLKSQPYRCSTVWRSRRMLSSTLTNATRIHLKMEQYPQSICWALAEDLKLLNGQEISPHNRVGWNKEEGKKKRRGNGGETCTSGEKLKVGRDSHIWGSSLTCREVTWDRRGASGAPGREQQLLPGRQGTARPAQKVCTATLSTPAWERCPPGCKDWVLEQGVWGADQGKGLLLTLRRQLSSWNWGHPSLGQP